MTTFDECPICLEEMNDTNTIVFLICKHWFHKICIEKWWEKLDIPYCPYCLKSSTGTSEDIAMRNLLKSIIIKILYANYSQTMNDIVTKIKQNEKFKINYFSRNKLPELVLSVMSDIIDRGYAIENNNIYYYNC